MVVRLPASVGESEEIPKWISFSKGSVKKQIGGPNDDDPRQPQPKSGSQRPLSSNPFNCVSV